ncbi:hypothetical protein BVRB_019320 [Beta vulgaris subsp. vulgaris]|uniref:Uncharacterized protein n=1 Tax=Beta vulgaris subsp. vulgaris TaxID=3555 RepID=A0A0J7YLN2_BETVV|nr:hypothetical protein BVRB_019320 [Beta vulgaris subsp. vulgaris]
MSDVSSKLTDPNDNAAAKVFHSRVANLAVGRPSVSQEFPDFNTDNLTETFEMEKFLYGEPEGRNEIGVSNLHESADLSPGNWASIQATSGQAIMVNNSSAGIQSSDDVGNPLHSDREGLEISQYHHVYDLL